MTIWSVLAALLGSFVGLAIGQLAYQIVAYYWLDDWYARRRQQRG